MTENLWPNNYSSIKLLIDHQQNQGESQLGVRKLSRKQEK